MRWSLDADGHEHVVRISGSTLVRTVEWQVDGCVIATESTSDERQTLTADVADIGVVGLRFPRWSMDARRVTLYAPGGEDREFDARAAATVGQGGVDFTPAPGSAAEKREARIRRHPTLHTLLLTSVGVARVVVPIVLGLIAFRFAVSLPWPSIPWPSIPWPDWQLPVIPWPEWQVPSIPWPSIELPNLAFPDWIRELLSKAKYVWPILLAFVLARGEVRRRRHQDALRKERESLDHSGPTSVTDLG